MCKCPEVAKLLKWHASHKSTDCQMRSVIDSPQRASVGRDIDPAFARDARNVYLGLVADGVNPYGNQNFNHSMWPILIVIFNLPPWLASRKFFVALTLIMLGARAPIVEAFDFMLQPSVCDLLKLWEGVPAWDVMMP